MLNLKLPAVQGVFPDYESPCCQGLTIQGICAVCNLPCAMPFYFASDKPMQDEKLIELESSLRAKLPVGASFVAWVPS